MPEQGHVEKRSLVRFLIAIPLKYAEISIKKLTGNYTYDISGSGVGLITAEELPVKTPLSICLKIPDNGEEIVLETEVIWSKQIEPSGYRSGLKLKYTQIKPIPLVLRTIYSKL